MHMVFCVYLDDSIVLEELIDEEGCPIPNYSCRESLSQDLVYTKPHVFVTLRICLDR